MSASTAERVAAGVQWLDENEPGWFRQIHVAGLDMSTCSRCVMGQIHGDYKASPMDGYDDDLAISLGFVARIERDGPVGRGSRRAEMDAEYAELTAEWVRVIEERRTQMAVTR